MAYEDFTTNSKNPLARFAHRTRGKVALSYVHLHSESKVLDFGCGDGDFLSKLSADSSSSKLVGFEPYMESKNAASALNIFRSWDEITAYCDINGLFDTVICFEVMEHFSKERQIEAIDKILKVLKADGDFIISVPIEKGLPVIPKNLRRIALSYKGNEEIYTLKNIACSLFGIKSQSLDRLRKGEDYLSHMGFYFTDLEDLLRKKFIISKISYSPLPKLPYFLNSQVFFQLKPL
jgi:SAM-dependent methyltransferase